jgi:hypothetical protein
MQLPRSKYFLFQYISNKMQSYTVYFIWKLLYKFWVVPTSTHHQERMQLCLQYLVFVTQRQVA